MFCKTLEIVLYITVPIIIVVTIYIRCNCQYWKRKNVPQIDLQVFENLKGLFNRQENIGITTKKLYDVVKQNNWKHGGFYLIFEPVYLVTDLEHVKNVLTKDFLYFVDRGVYYNEKDDPLSAHLFAIGGQKWKNLRKKLTPAFTSSKIKTMFPVFIKCANQLLSIVSDCGNNSVDVKEALACLTTNVIGCCAFGLELNTFEAEDSDFRKYGKRVFVNSNFEVFLRIFANTFPAFSKVVGIRVIPKEVSSFFKAMVEDAVKYRETNKYRREDFLQILIDLKNDGNEQLTMEEVAAQCFVFFLAGYETSSTTMTFALYELAKNQKIQDKVREEIYEVLAKHNNQVTYEAIQEMKYMNQVIDETLRKYPPVPFVTRQSASDYKVSDTDIVIEKGIKVMISIFGIHHDEEYYPNPEKFDPDRFTEENKQSRHGYAHIPFGEGPRICIGLRFALIQSKVCLAILLRKFKFTVDSKTKDPLKLDTRSFVLAVESQILLNIQKI